jgi:hypothetical protein
MRWRRGVLLCPAASRPALETEKPKKAVAFFGFSVRVFRFFRFCFPVMICVIDLFCRDDMYVVRQPEGVLSSFNRTEKYLALLGPSGRRTTYMSSLQNVSFT